jgi:hypothetical protein
MRGEDRSSFGSNGGNTGLIVQLFCITVCYMAFIIWAVGRLFVLCGYLVVGYISHCPDTSVYGVEYFFSDSTYYMKEHCVGYSAEKGVRDRTRHVKLDSESGCRLGAMCIGSWKCRRQTPYAPPQLAPPAPTPVLPRFEL